MNIHPYFGTSFRNWVLLLLENRGVGFRYIPRAFLITFIIILLAPFRVIAYLEYNWSIKKTKFEFPPIFIIGHWRSGTTYLHNLMSNDQQFGHICTFDSFFPYFGIWIRKEGTLFNRILKCISIKRPHDNITWSVTAPEEEEFAMAITSPFSFFHGWIFRKKWMLFFNKYILFKDVSDKILIRWKNRYNQLLQRITLCNNGKQLLLKNPYNTARIGLLLSLYPDAKFIHIYRNPYDVYASTRHMHEKTNFITLNDIDQKEIDDRIFSTYTEMMANFFEQARCIPEGNFAETKYEDLIANPLKQIEEIYKKLSLDGPHSKQKRFDDYLRSIENYKKNIFTLDKQRIQKIYRQWQRTIDMWGYKAPEGLTS